MSNLFNAVNQATARTANGAVTNFTSGQAALDLFGIIGAARGRDLTTEFERALKTDEDRAIRILLWARDVRGGAGERQQFRNLLGRLIKLNPELAKRVLVKIPEIGRFDDLLVAIGTPVQSTAVDVIANALVNRNGLCAKWMPRKGVVAAKLRRALDLTAREYRKLLVELTREAKVVEQLMCAGEWGAINYEHLPSLAAARLQKAFERNDPKGYAEYVSKLENGEAKVNASAIFPYDVYKSALSGNQTVADSQWKSLPDYIDSELNILPMVDVSGSMEWEQPVSGINCMDIAISLGLYCSERVSGHFNHQALTFSRNPKMIQIPQSGSLRERFRAFKQDVGYNTDFVRAFQVILKQARAAGLEQSDLPEVVLVFSDMEFDSCGSSTNFEAVRAEYRRYGYEMPKMVFWNLAGRPGNNPITYRDENTALVSGFSPAIMTAVLGAKQFDPVSIMDEAIMVDRYDY